MGPPEASWGLLQHQVGGSGTVTPLLVLLTTLGTNTSASPARTADACVPTQAATWLTRAGPGKERGSV